MPCFWALRALNTPANAEHASYPQLRENQTQAGTKPLGLKANLASQQRAFHSNGPGA